MNARRQRVLQVMRGPALVVACGGALGSVVGAVVLAGSLVVAIIVGALVGMACALSWGPAGAALYGTKGQAEEVRALIQRLGGFGFTTGLLNAAIGVDFVVVRVGNGRPGALNCRHTLVSDLMNPFCLPAGDLRARIMLGGLVILTSVVALIMGYCAARGLRSFDDKTRYNGVAYPGWGSIGAGMVTTGALVFVEYLFVLGAKWTAVFAAFLALVGAVLFTAAVRKYALLTRDTPGSGGEG